MPKKEQVYYDLFAMMQNALKKLGIKDPVKKYILLALNQSSPGDYAFNPSKSQIKGFLGEVYNNAFLMYMSGDNNSATLQKISPTGAFLNEKGKEMIIDTWLGGFGI
jgi:hypothetical protein